MRRRRRRWDPEAASRGRRERTGANDRSRQRQGRQRKGMRWTQSRWCWLRHSALRRQSVRPLPRSNLAPEFEPSLLSATYRVAHWPSLRLMPPLHSRLAPPLLLLLLAASESRLLVTRIERSAARRLAGMQLQQAQCRRQRCELIVFVWTWRLVELAGCVRCVLSGCGASGLRWRWRGE